MPFLRQNQIFSTPAKSLIGPLNALFWASRKMTAVKLHTRVCSGPQSGVFIDKTNGEINWFCELSEIEKTSKFRNLKRLNRACLRQEPLHRVLLEEFQLCRQWFRGLRCCPGRRGSCSSHRRKSHHRLRLPNSEPALKIPLIIAQKICRKKWQKNNPEKYRKLLKIFENMKKIPESSGLSTKRRRLIDGEYVKGGDPDTCSGCENERCRIARGADIICKLADISSPKLTTRRSTQGIGIICTRCSWRPAGDKSTKDGVDGSAGDIGGAGLGTRTATFNGDGANCTSIGSLSIFLTCRNVTFFAATGPRLTAVLTFLADPCRRLRPVFWTDELEDNEDWLVVRAGRGNNDFRRAFFAPTAFSTALYVAETDVAIEVDGPPAVPEGPGSCAGCGSKSRILFSLKDTSVSAARPSLARMELHNSFNPEEDALARPKFPPSRSDNLSILLEIADSSDSTRWSRRRNIFTVYKIKIKKRKDRKDEKGHTKIFNKKRRVCEIFQKISKNHLMSTVDHGGGSIETFAEAVEDGGLCCGVLAEFLEGSARQIQPIIRIGAEIGEYSPVNISVGTSGLISLLVSVGRFEERYEWGRLEIADLSGNGVSEFGVENLGGGGVTHSAHVAHEAYKENSISRKYQKKDLNAPNLQK